MRYLAVDEFAVHKGHRYMTVVLDLETGEILHAHHGRDADALVPFFWKLKRQGVRPRAVAMDMSEAYSNAVRMVFGHQVDIVHDPYHVVALASRAIDETRRDMVRQLEGEQRKVLKGTRYLLLQGLENLNDNALEQLCELMLVNEPLYQATSSRRNYAGCGASPAPQPARTSSTDGSPSPKPSATRTSNVERLAQTLDDHRPGLLAYFGHRISTGPLEGLNNKIKVLKRLAYGYRDTEYFQLRLFVLHEDLSYRFAE